MKKNINIQLKRLSLDLYTRSHNLRLCITAELLWELIKQLTIGSSVR